MRADKEQALRLRLSGRSYNEIARLLNVPKSTLSNWLSNVQLSERALKRIQGRVSEGALKGLQKRNKHQTHLAIQRMRTTRASSRNKIKTINKKGLSLIGAALYWAEGYKRVIVVKGKEKTNHPVSFANSDPLLIKIFLKFLREICEVPDKKIFAELRIYEHTNENATINYWSLVTALSKENFRKTYLGLSKSSQRKRPYNRLPNGTIAIRVNDTQLFHRIMGMIEGLAKNA